MKNYEPSFTFVKQNDNEIFAKSMDGNHNFVLPFNLDSGDLQEKMFKHLLNSAFLEYGGARVTLTQFEDITFSFEGVADRNVAKAICDRLIELNYCTYDDDKVVILNEIDETNIDSPILIKKWITFYDIAIESTKNAKNTAQNEIDKFKIKSDQMQNDLQRKALNYKKQINLLIEKDNKMGLSPEEEELKKQFMREILECGKTMNNDGMANILIKKVESFETILEGLDVQIETFQRAKGLLELGRESNESDLMHAIELNQKLVSCINPLLLNEEDL